jgi:hypothetical protein
VPVGTAPILAFAAAAGALAAGAGAGALTFHVADGAPPEIAALSPVQRAVLETYREDSAALPMGTMKPEGFTFTEVATPVLEGRLVHAYAWGLGGHAFWPDTLIYARAGRTDVLWARATSLDSEGYRRRLDGLRACAPGYRKKLLALFSARSASFETEAAKVDRAYCVDVDAELRAALGRALAAGTAGGAFIEELARVLVLAMHPGLDARILHDPGELRAPALRELLAVRPAPRARWVEGMTRPFHAPRLDAKGLPGALRLDAFAVVNGHGGAGDWLLEAHLVARAGGYALELETLAHTVVAIE